MERLEKVIDRAIKYWWLVVSFLICNYVIEVLVNKIGG